MIAGQMAGMTFNAPAYSHYVRSYELLADKTGIPKEVLLRRLGKFSTGRVRHQFVPAIVKLYEDHAGVTLSLSQRRKLRQAADVLFDGDKTGDPVDDDRIRAEWSKVFP